eukprot:4610949-Pyramimonas_sp.AAC.1
MEGSLVGSLQLVLADPTKPQSYEKRFEFSCPCTVLVIGPQYADPPEPTEASSACSEHPDQQE